MTGSLKQTAKQIAHRMKSHLSSTKSKAAPPSVLELTRASNLHAEGLGHARSGQWQQALRSFEAAVKEAPAQPNFNYTYGMALAHARRYHEAIKAFELEIAVVPTHGSALAELGGCLARTGRVREGISYLRKGIKYMPGLATAHFNLALALLGENHRLAAIQACSRAIAINGAYADAFGLRGLAYAMGDEDENSINDLYVAASLNKKHSQLLVSLGATYEQKSRNPHACNLFELAARMAPDMAIAQYAFGHFLINNHAYDLGLEYVERALALEPDRAPCHIAKGFGYLGQGRIDDAVACFRRGGELAPDDAKTAGTLLFALQHKPFVTKEELLEAHERWGRLYAPEKPKGRLDFRNLPDPDRKLRIGLVSADLNSHAVTFLTIRAFEQLAKLGYELYCFKTDRKRPDDAFSQRYKEMAHLWKDVTDLNDTELIALIEKQKIDILLDLSGHTAGCRLAVFARRAAPVQVTWAGYVGTVGLQTYDGLIADPVEVPPEHDEYYLEPVIRLPDCYVCYTPPAAAPEVGPLPVLRKNSFTFGCFNRPTKLNAELAKAWARILKQVDNARILIVYGGLDEKSTQEAIYKVFESGGLSRDRVDLIGHKEQARLLKAYSEEVDLALDPFPYSGGVTTLEAMWMGVPTLTLVGDTFAGRHAASHMTAAGLTEFCVESVDAYVEQAVAWTRRIDELTTLRAGLRERAAASPLHDPIRFGGNLDAAFRTLWQDWCSQRSSGQTNPASL